MSFEMPLADSVAIAHLGSGICSAYCTKLLVDGGARATWIESPEGDPLRRRSASGAKIDATVGGPLFQFLAASTQSVTIDVARADECARAWAIIESADIVIWSPGSPVADSPEFSPSAIRERAPRAIVVTITDFGLCGMDPVRPASEFTLQAMSGGWVSRGRPDREPLMVGGSHGDWMPSIFAALGAMAAWVRSRETGRGELVDVSRLDAMHLTQPFFGGTYEFAAKQPQRYVRTAVIPLNHPTKDGFVGFQITTGQQWLDFCVLVERPDWAEDPSLTRFDTRIRRQKELLDYIDSWTSQRTTADVLELAALFRLPVAPVNNGKTVTEFEQVVAREWLIENSFGGFMQPLPPYTFWGDLRSRPPGPAPKLGEHNAIVPAPKANSAPTAPASVPAPLPFAGLRILDFTAFWAGPIIGHFFAILGADVIHIESTKRPDGLRSSTLRHDMSEGWWEASPHFAGTNTNKRGLTLDMSSPEGRELAMRLILQADILVENFSSRVMDQWGLTYEALREINPKLIMLRASGFGNSGPWKDHVAYATTVEQAAGMTWVTGFADDRPEQSGGSCDPLAGSHAALAIIYALEHRRRTGKGMLLETPQFTTGLNICAEQIIEYTATGTVLERTGNRDWTCAPQGAYRVADWDPPYDIMPNDDWIAISVMSDEQWQALCRVIGASEFAADPELATVSGRMKQQDKIDEAISVWCRNLPADDAVKELLRAGVPAARFQTHAGLYNIPEVVRRGTYEMVDQSVLGRVPIVGYPAQFENGPRKVHRSPAPTLGEHNREILEGVLGLSGEEVDKLEAAGIIGNRPKMGAAW